MSKKSVSKKTQEHFVDKTTNSERKILAIMFSDIKGYSAMMGADEENAFRLLDEHNAIIFPIIKKFNGEILKLIGDAILASFISAVDATNCAYEVQSNLSKYNQQQPSKQQIWIRIGVHVGDVLLKNGDVFGDGVNIAARLEPIAEPGGICISQTVKDIVQASSKFKLESLGKKVLKNIKDPMTVYRIKCSGKPNKVSSISSVLGFFRSIQNIIFKSVLTLPSFLIVVGLLAAAIVSFIGYGPKILQTRQETQFNVASEKKKTMGIKKARLNQNKKTNPIHASSKQLLDSTSQTNQGPLVFINMKDVPLKVLLTMIFHSRNKSYILSNDIKEKKVSAVIDHLTLDQAIESICVSENLEFSKSNGVYIIKAKDTTLKDNSAH